jgi:hypothetical protein
MPHSRLPIHRRGCELVKLAFQIQQHMPRGQKRLLGEKITRHCTDMVDLMAMANASRGEQRAGFIRELLQRVHAVQVLLRVCVDLQFVSIDLWARAIQVLENIGKQGGGWLKSAKAPAA